MDRIYAATIGALTGALIGASITLYLARQRIRRENILATATFLEGVAASLSGMAASFEAGKIPHEHGHRLAGLIPHFDKYVRPHLQLDGYKLLKQVWEAARKALDVDSNLYKDFEPDPEKRTQLIVELKRLVGDLLAAADQLRGSQQGILHENHHKR